MLHFIALKQAEGVYGVSPKLPAIGGSEGVAVVEQVGHSSIINVLLNISYFNFLIYSCMQVGASVQSLKAGDWVLPRSSTFGKFGNLVLLKMTLFFFKF